MIDLGTYLREKREERGMTLDHVANATKIRKTLLEQLEENNFKFLPEKVFVRGFVRAYATETGANLREALDLFEDQFGRSESGSSGPTPTFRSAAPQAAPTSEGPRFRMSYLVLVIVALLTFTVAFFVQTMKTTNQQSVSSSEQTDVDSGTTRSLQEQKSGVD